MTKTVGHDELRKILAGQTITDLIYMYYARWTKEEIIEDIVTGNDDEALTELLRKNGWDFRVKA